MTKQEREALREYVGAVCQYVESGTTLSIHGLVTSVRVAVGNKPPREMPGDEFRSLSAQRLNAADDRLRALGMLA